MKLKSSVIVIALALTACVQDQAPIYKTPSGRPEAIFPNSTTEQVSNKLADLCASKGHVVSSVNNNQVICGGQMDGGRAIVAQALIGNSYSTTPEQYVQFTLFKTPAGVRVQAQQWIQTQMAFGQTNRQEINSGASFNSTAKALMSIGGKPV